MRGITSGLQPRRYEDGDLVEKDKGFFGGVMDFFKEYGPMASLPMAAYEYATDPEKAKERYTKEGLSKRNEQFKDYIFDYTDPIEYATLPLYLAGPAGAAANKGIKAARVANKIKKAGPAENILDKKVTKGILNIGGPVAAISADIAIDPEIDFEDVVDAGKYYGTQAVDYIKDIFSNDAVDDAQEDVDEANKKETEKEDEKDENLTEEEKEKKSFLEKMGQVFEAYGASQGVGSSPKGIAGQMIRGTAIDTPEITRYQGGGIADMMPQEPMMMANGGIANYSNEIPEYFLGGLVKIGKGILKGGKDYYKKVTKKEAKGKGADVDKKKPDTKKKKDTKEETGVTKDAPVKEPILPPEFKYIAGAPIGLGKKVLETLGGVGGIGRGAVRAGVYGTAGTMGYNYLDPFGKKKETEIEYQGSSEDAAKVNKSESLREFHLENSMARAQEAGRDTPNFMDYLSSFPKSYTDKIGSDPEFSQQMMAGFLAMMKPTEGFVPRNAFVDFGEAAMAEGARQEGEIPDQLKLMERLKKDPELLDAMRKYARTSKPLTATELETEMMAVERMLKKSIYGDNVKDDDKVYKRPATEGEALGMPIAPSTLYQMYLDAGENLEAVREKVTGDGS